MKVRDISLIGASAALAISGLPFEGPISAARVGFVDGSYVLNPDNESLEKSMLDMVVAGTKDAILMLNLRQKNFRRSNAGAFYLLIKKCKKQLL